VGEKGKDVLSVRRGRVAERGKKVMSQYERDGVKKVFQVHLGERRMWKEKEKLV